MNRYFKNSNRVLSEQEVEEIKVMYRDCKDKKAQVQILKELYLIDEADVVSICEIDNKDPSFRHYTRWTPELDSHVLSEREKGTSYEEIAKELNTTPQAIRTHLSVLDHKKPDRTRLRQRKKLLRFCLYDRIIRDSSSVRSFAKKYGFSYQILNRFLNGEGKLSAHAEDLMADKLHITKEELYEDDKENVF